MMQLPASVQLKKLNGGVVLDIASQLAEPGSMQRLNGFQLARDGLRRRGSFRKTFEFFQLDPVQWPIVGNVLFYADDSLQNLILTRRSLFKIDDENETATSLMPYLAGETTKEIGDLTRSTGYLTLTSAAFDFAAEGILINDLVTFFTNDLDEIKIAEAVVRSVTSGTATLELVDIGRLPEGTYKYTIQEAFFEYPDFSFREGELYVVDNSIKGVYVYNGATFEALNLTQDPSLIEINAIATFGNRIWIGGLTEDGVEHRHRVRWTTVTDFTEFPVAQYVDLIGQRTEIQRLVPLGNLLVVYFQDAIYFGRPTNIVGLPYDFTPFDTGGVGLVGPRALTSWLDAHWFVGQDDIYAFSATRALERIGSAVLKETIYNQNYVLSKTIVLADPANERVIFQFFNKTGQCDRLWCYYYKLNGWSTEAVANNGLMRHRKIIDTLWFEIGVGDTWESEAFAAPWRFFDATVEGEMLYSLRNGLFYRYIEDGLDSQMDLMTAEQAISVDFITNDIDFGSPDTVKTITMLSVKLDRLLTSEESPLGLIVSVATNREAAFKPVGTITIGIGYDEGKVNFRVTGSQFRFKVSSTSNVASYTITEIGLRIRERGREVRYGR